MIIWLSPSV